MNRFFTLLLAASCLTAVGQVTYPYNPDGNADGLIQVTDLMDLLSAYGLPWANEFVCGQEIFYSGVSYKTIEIAGDCWLAKNLRTSSFNQGQDLQFLEPDSVFGEYVTYGREMGVDAEYLYPQSVAVSDSICPMGWHLSTGQEWSNLIDGFGSYPDLGYFLKTEGLGGTDVIGFGAKASGVRHPIGELPQGYLNLFLNENAPLHIGKYSENFNDNLAQGWTTSGAATTVSWTDRFELFYFNDCFWGGSGCTHTSAIYSPVLSLNSEEAPASLSYNIWVNWSSSCDYDFRFYVQLNQDGNWIELEHQSCEFSGGRNWDLSEFDCDEIQFKWQSTYFEWCRMELDNINFETNLYPGYDTPNLDLEFFGGNDLLRFWVADGPTNSIEFSSSNNGLMQSDVNPAYYQSVRCIKDID